MKKFFQITIAAIMIAAIAVPVMATGSRLEALGDVDNYIEDSANIFKWPATLPSFANVVTVDITPGGTGSYGFLYGLGEYGDYGTIGLFFEENTPGPNHIWDESFDKYYPAGQEWDDCDVFNEARNNKFKLLYAYEMDKMAIGIKFIRASKMHLDEIAYPAGDTTDYSYAYTTIGASARMDINDDMYADFGFDYTMVSSSKLNDLATDTEETEDANMMLNFNGRLFYEYSDVITFVPYVGYGMFDFSIASTDTNYVDEAYGLKGMSFDLGFAANFTVNEDNMIILGIEPFSYLKVEPSGYDAGYKEEFSTSLVSMPRFLLAYETDVKDWLTIRTGCTKTLLKRTATYNDVDAKEYTEEETYAPFDWHLGLAFHVSDFDIDCVLAKDTPFVMGHWLTGYEAKNQVISRITAVYHF